MSASAILLLFRRRALFSFLAGMSLSSATFSRASAATYTENVTDTLSAYEAGHSLADATHTRASAATYTLDS